jgi:A/G-specific adenine glycosylase
MERGALVCTARAPRCTACPVADACAWRAAGFPPPTTAPRTQAWAGTDRQARGRIMAALRDAVGPLAEGDLAAAWPHDDAQRERALAGLLADGLVARVPGGLALPE